MKQRETGSGRGCESPHLHQKHNRYAYSIQRHKKRDYVFDGGA